MDAHHEAVMDRRAGLVLGLVVAHDDTGMVQTVDVLTHDGMHRTGIEVYQSFGHSGLPPLLGATVLLAAIGGDEGHFVALAQAAPGTRFGNLAEGDSVLYDAGGDRVAVRMGGTIEVLAASDVTVRVGAIELLVQPTGITAIGNTTIDGNLTVVGFLSVQGTGAGGIARIVGDVAIEGALGVTGNVGVSGDLSVGGVISGAWAGH